MKIEKKQLLEELEQISIENIQQFEQFFKNAPIAALNWKAAPEKWSVLECMEHLNFYGDHYLNAIHDAFARQGTSSKSQQWFKTGWLGRRFADQMRPLNDQRSKKMKTLKISNPIYSGLRQNTLQQFEKQQNEYLEIARRAKDYDLYMRIPTSLGWWLRLRLGDTLRIVIFHNQRHIAQALGVLEQYKSTQ